MLVAVIVGLRWLRGRPHLGGKLRAAAGRWRWTRAAYEFAAGAVKNAASLSVRDWAAGGGVALANWLLDVVCLVAVAHAFGLQIGVVQITGMYLAIQLVRQIPADPGGVGVVEASLLVALVALGATSGTATAVVLVYRLLSTWLLVPVGLLAWVALRPARTASALPQQRHNGGESLHEGAADPEVADAELSPAAKQHSRHLLRRAE